MPALKSIHTRLQMKNDTESNWDKAVNFVPLDGEVIIYDVDANNSKPRIKIGDGSTVVSSLPFLSNGYTVEEQVLVIS